MAHRPLSRSEECYPEPVSPTLRTREDFLQEVQYINNIFHEFTLSHWHRHPEKKSMNLLCPLCLRLNTVQFHDIPKSCPEMDYIVPLAQSKTSVVLKHPKAKTLLRDIRAFTPLSKTSQCPFTFCKFEDTNIERLYLVSPSPPPCDSKTSAKACIAACLLLVVSDHFVDPPASCLGSNQRAMCFVEHCTGYISIGTTSLPSIPAEKILFDLCTGNVDPRYTKKLIDIFNSMSQSVLKTNLCTIH